MPSYVARATVTALLPAGHGISNDDVDTYIGRASLEVDELSGNDFPKSYESSTQKFPEIDNGTYTTPATIEECAKLLALYRCYQILLENNFAAEDIEKEMNRFRSEAERKLEQVRSGEIDLGMTKQTLLYAAEKYPEDETSLDSKFTNDAMDAHSY